MVQKSLLLILVSSLACVVIVLTEEGSCREFALIHAGDGAVGAHGATRSEAVENLACFDQCFASQAACKFTVCLGQRGKTSHQNSSNVMFYKTIRLRH